MTLSDRPIERRNFLKLGVAGTLSLLTTGGSLTAGTQAARAEETPSLDPDTALQKLMEGNQRFTRHRPQYPDQTQARVTEVSYAQHPFATILSCADSRVPAELIFDQGIGSLFDVRVAGNIVTPETLGSLEYAIALLNTPLLMVLGHERCGAVTAAVQNEALPGDIGSFVKAILPAIDAVKGQEGDPVENAVIANVNYQMEAVGRSPLVRERLQTGTLKVVGGRYDLDSGRVTLLA